MSLTGKIRKKVIKKSRLQDIIFISGILVFTSALVLGLLPASGLVEGAAKEYFIYLITIIPVIAAIYFIIIAFSRKIYFKTTSFTSSIVFKMMLAFTSVAVLPSLAIIIISNNIINSTISNLITNKTTAALEESINFTGDYLKTCYNDVEGEIKSLDYVIKKGFLNPELPADRSLMLRNYKFKGYDCIVYKVNEKNIGGNKLNMLVNDYGHESRITKYYRNADLDSMLKISSLSIGTDSILIGHFLYKKYIISLIRPIPQKIFNRLTFYKDSLKSYKEQEFLKPYFHAEIGIFLLFIAILIVLISLSVSFFLTRSFTRPMLELAEATGHVSSGDFHITLSRDSQDEISVLFRSFNKMVKDLDESRKALYHVQKLEAWRDVARRIVHEIKNPLTPIQLSAERIQNRYREKHPGIGNIINAGTETIIEEVKVLNRILEEFSGFARLPEVNAECQDINQVIENSVNFFLGHEGIFFHLNLDRSLPAIFIDKMLIRQALTNILQNSVDSIGKSGNIYVYSGLADGKPINVKITIKDDGPGIKPEDLDKIFDPSFSTKETGTGLGLAIVEKIVLEHGGTIYCNSEVNEGAEFNIELPISEGERG